MRHLTPQTKQSFISHLSLPTQQQQLLISHFSDSGIRLINEKMLSGVYFLLPLLELRDTHWLPFKANVIYKTGLCTHRQRNQHSIWKWLSFPTVSLAVCSQLIVCSQYIFPKLKTRALTMPPRNHNCSIWFGLSA